jgi:hypothetical protein
VSAPPSRDAVEFATAVTLGAVLGWVAVSVLRDDPPPSPGRRLRLSRRAEPGVLDDVKREARDLFVESGEELARMAVGKIRRALIGPPRPRER